MLAYNISTVYLYAIFKIFWPFLIYLFHYIQASDFPSFKIEFIYKYIIDYSYKLYVIYKLTTSPYCACLVDRNKSLIKKRLKI